MEETGKLNWANLLVMILTMFAQFTAVNLLYTDLPFLIRTYFPDVVHLEWITSRSRRVMLASIQVQLCLSIIWARFLVFYSLGGMQIVMDAGMC